MAGFNGLPFSTGSSRPDMGQYGVSLFRSREPRPPGPTSPPPQSHSPSNPQTGGAQATGFTVKPW
jgi:hypothetical protein